MTEKQADEIIGLLQIIAACHSVVAICLGGIALVYIGVN